jgi:hypothetical protein
MIARDNESVLAPLEGPHPGPTLEIAAVTPALAVFEMARRVAGIATVERFDASFRQADRFGMGLGPLPAPRSGGLASARTPAPSPRCAGRPAAGPAAGRTSRGSLDPAAGLAGLTPPVAVDSSARLRVRAVAALTRPGVFDGRGSQDEDGMRIRAIGAGWVGARSTPAELAALKELGLSITPASRPRAAIVRMSNGLGAAASSRCGPRSGPRQRRDDARSRRPDPRAGRRTKAWPRGPPPRSNAPCPPRPRGRPRDECRRSKPVDPPALVPPRPPGL